MDQELRELRDTCREYPRPQVVDAVRAGLVDVVVDVEERRGLAALLVAWLTNVECVAEIPPPLTPSVIAAIRQELHRRAS
jgi:hypothetical protein